MAGPAAYDTRTPPVSGVEFGKFPSKQTFMARFFPSARRSGHRPAGPVSPDERLRNIKDVIGRRPSLIARTQNTTKHKPRKLLHV
jgi:hypothetical protein